VDHTGADAALESFRPPDALTLRHVFVAARLDRHGISSARATRHGDKRIFNESGLA